MERNGKLIDLIKKQKAIEDQVSKSVEEQLETVNTMAGRLLLTEMKFDAKKHSAILQGILDAIENNSETQLWDHKIHSYVDKLVAKKELERHIVIEKTTLDMAKKEMKHTNDSGIKLLLQHIAEDEDRHHNLLKTIVDNSYKIND
jgi:rubrerythrin